MGPASETELGAAFRAELAGSLSQPIPGFGVTLRSRATSVADGTRVLDLRDGDGDVRGVVLCSSPAAPDMAARDVARARLAREALGPSLGGVVLEPLAAGRLDGLSYSVMPFCRPLSDRRVLWAMQRRVLVTPLLTWLAQATERTASPVAASGLDSAFAAPLRHLAGMEQVPGPLRAAAEQAGERLAAGAWRPRHVLMHGDLWKGNVLLRPRDGVAPWHRRFVLIDWAGSEARGYALYDLVRLALSFGLAPSRLGSEVRRHCRLLECDVQDAAAHLAAALGHLALHLEHFPLARFIETAGACHGALARSLEGH